MEQLFENNMAMIFIVAAVAIITYTNFAENQRIVLIYLLAYASAFWEVLRIAHTLLLLALFVFFYLEYLSDDRKKTELIVNVWYKILDYIYMMLFQYHVLLILLAFVCMWADRQEWAPPYVCSVCSVVFMFAGIHLAVSQPFKVKTITEIFHTFEKIPMYDFNYNKDMQIKYDILCEIEDKSYFKRINSYSFFSIEYFSYICKKLWNKLSSSCSVRRRIRYGTTYICSNISYRGYSTPEMQLLRNLAVVRGYDKYKFSRKIYEIIYSKIFFASLKSYYKKNAYNGLKYFRHYLLNIYINVVPIRIHGKKYQPFINVYGKLYPGKEFYQWTNEAMFVACLGLCFRNVSQSTLLMYKDVIQNYHLNIKEIERISMQMK